MKLSQELWTAAEINRVRASEAPTKVDLVLGFGARELLSDETVWRQLRERWGSALVVACGEISPFTPTARCELHNQTMTITTFSEV